ncbi:MAG: 3-dehydroquinate synthase family protein [Bdellovibrio sp.]
MDFENSILIYDRVLEKKFGSWIRRFEKRHRVSSGESLKAIENFARHVRTLTELSSGAGVRDLQIVAFGGGSVGDFAGFVASTFKRGVRLVHVPSTWLSAIDSAHGGKTALNVGGIKNQIGTFYEASDVYMCRQVLLTQGQQRFEDAKAEAAKVALLNSPRLWKQVQRIQSGSQLFEHLPGLVKAKLKIVTQDPQEKLGVRHLLNFGHTLGHVFESALGMSHGRAISLGLRFALSWSGAKLGDQVWGLAPPSELRAALLKLKNPVRFLAQDKKLVSKKRIRFIFLTRPGYPVIREVSISEILAEIERQRG